MATLGYVRVSTAKQNLDRQHDALTAFGVDRIFEDKVSGAKFKREGLTALLDYAREGDTVVVQSLDRLGRSLSEVVRVADDLLKRGIALRTLAEGIDYSTATGRMVAGIFASLAEFERTLINERAADARAAARARGKQTGRPRALSAEQLALARRMKASGESMATICETLKVSRATLYRVLGDVHSIAADEPRAEDDAPDRQAPVCEECGGAVKNRKKHPVKGEGWFCSKCVQRAKDEQYQALQQERKAERIAAMSPERRAEYEKNLAASQRGEERRREGMAKFAEAGGVKGLLSGR